MHRMTRPLDQATRTTAAAALVLDIVTAAGGERDLDAILRAALDRLGGVIRFTGGSIALVEDDDLVIRAAVGPFQDEALGQRLRRGASRSWSVIETRRPIRLDDLMADGLRSTGAKASQEIRSWLAVPILRRGGGAGLLEVDSPEPGAFSTDDERLLATIADALAGPIDLAARYAEEEQARMVRDAFVGVVSHELRTPITTIFGMSRILQQQAATMAPEVLAQVVDDIADEADRLRRLTEDLLVLSRAEAGRLSLAQDPILVGHVTHRVVDSEKRRWPDHRFTAVVPVDVPIVLGEDLHLEQIVRNLVGNAAKYSPAGSSIDVQVAVEGDAVTVRVLDAGPGLPETAEDRARLFELYHRAPEAMSRSSGAGIGLFVCRQLVEAMGGRIWAVPRDGRSGSEFGFRLPAMADEEAQAT